MQKQNRKLYIYTILVRCKAYREKLLSM